MIHYDESKEEKSEKRKSKSRYYLTLKKLVDSIRHFPLFPHPLPPTLGQVMDNDKGNKPIELRITSDLNRIIQSSHFSLKYHEPSEAK